MPRFRRRSRSRLVGKKRKLEWVSESGMTPNANFEIGNLVSFGPSVFAWVVRAAAGISPPDNSFWQFAEEDCTLERTIVNFTFIDTGDGTGFEENHMYHVAAGLLARDDMTAAELLDYWGTNGNNNDTTGFFPDPINGAYDWIWRHVQPVAVRGSNFVFGAPLNPLQMESRAKRKLDFGSALIFYASVWDLQVPSGQTPDVSLSVGFDVRYLLKTP